MKRASPGGPREAPDRTPRLASDRAVRRRQDAVQDAEDDRDALDSLLLLAGVAPKPEPEAASLPPPAMPHLAPKRTARQQEANKQARMPQPAGYTWVSGCLHALRSPADLATPPASRRQQAQQRYRGRRKAQLQEMEVTVAALGQRLRAAEVCSATTRQPQ